MKKDNKIESENNEPKDYKAVNSTLQFIGKENYEHFKNIFLVVEPKDFYEPKEGEIEAMIELENIRKAKLLIKDNDLACEIYIKGVKISLCNNESILPALENQENEIRKFLSGEANLWVKKLHKYTLMQNRT